MNETTDPWEIVSEVTPALMPGAMMTGLGEMQRAMRDALPILTAPRGGFEFLLPGDPGYEEKMERGRRKAILRQALDRLCACPKHCWGCDCRSEHCPIHGDDDLEGNE